VWDGKTSAGLRQPARKRDASRSGLGVTGSGRSLGAALARVSANRAFDVGALTRAVEQYRGDLLPGCYDDWVASERERQHQRYGRALERLIALLEEQGAYPIAIERAERLLRHDSLDEATYRTLMRLHGLNRDRVRAVRIYHECVSMLERELAVEPGAATRETYEALLSPDTRPGLPTVTRPLSTAIPLVGRKFEWNQLQSAWQDARAGAPGLAVLAGEAGIGKTRLAEELLTWASRQGIGTARARAYASEGRLSYGPVADWLRSDALRQAGLRLDAHSLSEGAAPAGAAERPTRSPTPAGLAEQQERQQFFQSLARATLSTSEPLLLLLDDLQWCDQDTLEWLHFLLRFDPDAPLLVVGTIRLEEVGPRHTVARLLTDVRSSGLLTELTLGPLDASETAELAMCVAGRALDPEHIHRLYDETEGQPLFVVETIRAGLGARDQASWFESRLSSPVGIARASDLGRLPPKVHAVIAARLAQLSDAARETVSLAATIGRSFTLDLLVQASTGEIDSLVGPLDELWQRQTVREHGSSAYDFSHDKIREVAYGQLSAARRSMLHGRVAHALERTSVPNLDAVSAQVATHYEQAGLHAQAVPYYQRAAALAQRVYAHFDAIQFLKKGLALLVSLPPGRERDARELVMQTALGMSLVATKAYGAPEVMTAYMRARELCQQLGNPPSPPVLRALAIASIAHADFEQAHGLGEHLLSLATLNADPMLLVEGHYVLGVTLFWKGALAGSRTPRTSPRALCAGSVGYPPEPVCPGSSSRLPLPVGNR
jgi:predicted ATPase